MALVAGIKRKHQELHAVDHASSSLDHQPMQQTSRSVPTGADSDSYLISKRQILDNELGAFRRHRLFEPNASIVIIGVRGVGKSSLAILASSAYRRRLVEVEKVFLDQTGMTPSTFRNVQGSASYHVRHAAILEAALEENSTGCVIVCGFADVEKDGAGLLEAYSRSHPVIHVTRHLKGIQSHVRLWSEEKIGELVRVSTGILRACSNLEFYNISEDMEQASPDSDHSGQLLTERPHGPFLTLKRAENDFLRLLRNVIGGETLHSPHHTFYPLSKVRLEDTEYASAVRLPVTDVVGYRLDLDDAQTAVDAVELEIAIEPDDSQLSQSRKQTLLDMISEAVAIVRRSSILPIITSIKRDHTSPRRIMTELDVIDHCLRLGPDYCRVNLPLHPSVSARLLASGGRTRLIASSSVSPRPLHGWQDPECMRHCESARRAGYELIDISMPAGQTSDTFDALAFSNRLSSDGANITSHCTGKLGQSSQILNPYLTRVDVPERSEEISPCIMAAQRISSLFSCRIYSPLRFFIYGQNIRFSLSPAMHNAGYRACGMSHKYSIRPSAGLDDFTNLVREHDFGGSSIVQPFRTDVIRFLDQLSPQARTIGAVNTVVAVRDGGLAHADSSKNYVISGRNRDGPVKALYGDNTDWIGIRACIRRGLSPANAVRPQTTAMVCGAGGMARAGIFALITLGVKDIFVCNRTRARAEALAEHYNRLAKSQELADASSVNTDDVHIEVLESFSSIWPSEARHPTIILSCIPSQTADGDATNFTIPPSWLQNPTAGVVVELAYMPVVTPVVLQIRALAHKGWILVDGLEVVPEQAFAQFELFTGKRAPRKLMRAEVLKRYNEDEVPLRDAVNAD